MTKNMDRQVAKNSLAPADKDAALARLTTSGEYAPLADADFIIEAVPELLHVKKDIYEKLKPLLKPETILASNTSSISITKLAALTGRPEKFIGMHFFNPVPMMKLVELIRGIATSRSHLQHRPRSRDQTRQNRRHRRGLPRLHRQPHPLPDDQRGDFRAA